MSFKTLRVAGTVTAAQTADDAAHHAVIGKLSPAASYRVTEFGGQDALFLISDDYPVASSSNGFYLKAGTTTTVVPDTRPFFVGDAPVALDGTDSDSSDAGDQILLETGTVGAEYDTSFLILNHAQHGFRISVINETAGSDGAVRVEEVVIGQSGV